MKIYKKISFLIIIALFGSSYMIIGNSYENAEFLFFGTSKYYGVCQEPCSDENSYDRDRFTLDWELVYRDGN